MCLQRIGHFKSRGLTWAANTVYVHVHMDLGMFVSWALPYVTPAAHGFRKRQISKLLEEATNSLIDH